MVRIFRLDQCHNDDQAALASSARFNDPATLVYEKLFGLQRTPLSMVPDPDYVHVTGQHADGISGAFYGILERRGCLALTGEAGLGKTTAIRVLLELLDSYNLHTSLIPHAMLNFGIPQPALRKAQRIKGHGAFSDGGGRGRQPRRVDRG
jgi:type II secretory pathway predicted ATPase ExeA